MSMPRFPELPDGLGLESSVCQILTSIALEEVGLSHIINAEGEKIQYVLGTLPHCAPPVPPTVEQILQVNESVRETLQQIGFSQIFLNQKMSDALKIYEKCLCKCGGACPGNPGGGNPGGGTTPPDDKYNHFRPVGNPPHIFEKVDENGKGKNPPEYVYNPDDKPGNGNDRPAIPDGNGTFWVEEKPPGNVWLPVDNNGYPDADKAKWGGPDLKPGGGDDKNVKKIGGDWWVDMGQNVWRKVTNKFTLGPLTGGGPTHDPVASPGTPVFEDKNGKYYIKNGKDSDNNDLYYGDPANGNGYLDSTQNGLGGDDVIYYKDKDGNMTTVKPPGGGTPGTPGQPQPTNVHVTLQPTTVDYKVGALPVQFTATVTGNDLISGTGNNAVTWEINPASGASLTTGGVFTANQPGVYTITARAKDDPTQTATATITVTVESESDHVLHADLGEVISIDNRDWIKIKEKVYEGKHYAMLMLKDVIGPMAYDTTNKSDMQYTESELRDKVDSWYQYLSSPNLKAMAVECQVGVNGALSWPTKGTGMYAHIPTEGALKGFGADVRVTGKSYWLANPVEVTGAGKHYQDVLKYDGTIGPVHNNDSSIYTRPVVWVLLY